MTKRTSAVVVTKQASPAEETATFVLSLYAKAISRKREHLTLVTEYTHSNLVEYIRDLVLPEGWVVHAPRSGAVGISQFPTAHDDKSEHALELSHLANYLGDIDAHEAEDQLEGHCETCAVYLSDEVVKLLDSKPELPPSDVLSTTYTSLNENLMVLSWVDCVARIFSAERRVRTETTRGQARQLERTDGFWDHATRAVDFIAGTPGLPSLIQSACNTVATTGRHVVVPIYVLNCASCCIYLLFTAPMYSA
jgi:hypothetical protein